MAALTAWRGVQEWCVRFPKAPREGAVLELRPVGVEGGRLVLESPPVVRPEGTVRYRVAVPVEDVERFLERPWRVYDGERLLAEAEEAPPRAQPFENTKALLLAYSVLLRGPVRRAA